MTKFLCFLLLVVIPFTLGGWVNPPFFPGLGGLLPQQQWQAPQQQRWQAPQQQRWQTEQQQQLQTKQQQQWQAPQQQQLQTEQQRQQWQATQQQQFQTEQQQQAPQQQHWQATQQQQRETEQQQQWQTTQQQQPPPTNGGSQPTQDMLNNVYAKYANMKPDDWDDKTWNSYIDKLASGGYSQKSGRQAVDQTTQSPGDETTQSSSTSESSSASANSNSSSTDEASSLANTKTSSQSATLSRTQSGGLKTLCGGLDIYGILKKIVDLLHGLKIGIGKSVKEQKDAIDVDGKKDEDKKKKDDSVDESEGSGGDDTDDSDGEGSGDNSSTTPSTMSTGGEDSSATPSTMSTGGEDSSTTPSSVTLTSEDRIPLIRKVWLRGLDNYISAMQQELVYMDGGYFQEMLELVQSWQGNQYVEAIVGKSNMDLLINNLQSKQSKPNNTIDFDLGCYSLFFLTFDKEDLLSGELQNANEHLIKAMKQNSSDTRGIPGANLIVRIKSELSKQKVDAAQEYLAITLQYIKSQLKEQGYANLDSAQAYTLYFRLALSADQQQQYILSLCQKLFDAYQNGSAVISGNEFLTLVAIIESEQYNKLLIRTMGKDKFDAIRSLCESQIQQGSITIDTKIAGKLVIVVITYILQYHPSLIIQLQTYGQLIQQIEAGEAPDASNLGSTGGVSGNIRL